MMLSRRDLGKLALAGLPVLLRSAPGGSFRVGAATESFHDFARKPGRDNVDDIIPALKAAGVTEIDLASVNTEAPSPDTGLPPPPPPGPYGGPPAGFTPAELAARKRALRDNLRKWRLATPASHYAELKNRFQAAGIAVYAMSFQHDDAFTDDEIEATFAHAAALGVEVISSQADPSMAKRLAPFAEKHAMLVAFRNQRETAAQISELASLSPRFRVNLDIGNFTAANQEAVAFLQENHQRVTHLMVRDRTRNNGGDEAFGSGDTPIRAVMALLKDKQYPIRAFVDYEYVGLGTPQEEVRKCLAYVRASLA
jgi:sugar phosphate isomerase/epimerase